MKSVSGRKWRRSSVRRQVQRTRKKYRKKSFRKRKQRQRKKKQEALQKQNKRKKCRERKGFGREKAGFQEEKITGAVPSDVPTIRTWCTGVILRRMRFRSHRFRARWEKSSSVDRFRRWTPERFEMKKPLSSSKSPILRIPLS